MTNAAYQLAYQLREWEVPKGQTPQGVRGFESIDDLDAWREVQRVTELVADVDRTLAGMDANGENVSMFLETLPKWYAGAHFAAIPWDSTNPHGPRKCCSPIEISLLEALGALIASGGPGWEFTEENRRSITDILDAAKQLIEEDTDMPTEVRRYVWSLIARAHTILSEHEKFGPGPIRSISLELGGAMQARGQVVEHDGNTERGHRWKTLAAQLVIGFAGGVASGSADALVQGTMKQLGGG